MALQKSTDGSEGRPAGLGSLTTGRVVIAIEHCRNGVSSRRRAWGLRRASGVLPDSPAEPTAFLNMSSSSYSTVLQYETN